VTFEQETLASAVEFTNLHKAYGERWEGEWEMRQMALAPGP
jgi:hypothetical protein